MWLKTIVIEIRWRQCTSEINQSHQTINQFRALIWIIILDRQSRHFVCVCVSVRASNRIFGELRNRFRAVLIANENEIEKKKQKRNEEKENWRNFEIVRFKLGVCVLHKGHHRIESQHIDDPNRLRKNVWISFVHFNHLPLAFARIYGALCHDDFVKSKHFVRGKYAFPKYTGNRSQLNGNFHQFLLLLFYLFFIDNDIIEWWEK